MNRQKLKELREEFKKDAGLFGPTEAYLVQLIDAILEDGEPSDDAKKLEVAYSEINTLREQVRHLQDQLTSPTSKQEETPDHLSRKEGRDE